MVLEKFGEHYERIGLVRFEHGLSPLVYRDTMKGTILDEMVITAEQGLSKWYDEGEMKEIILR